MSSVNNASQAENREARTEPEADVQITGRNVEVPEHFAERVNGKLAKIERLDPTLNFFHVELQHEPNPRRSDESDRIQITATGKGHIARAEAKEDSFYAALEVAIGRMERSLRKVKARRKISRSGHRAPISVGEATAALVEDAQPQASEAKAGQAQSNDEAGKYDVDPYEEMFRPGQVVRTKEHEATPKSVDEALSEMELVGHDFYLFINEETKQPSVVYRRHAFDYGLISLKNESGQ